MSDTVLERNSVEYNRWINVSQLADIDSTPFGSVYPADFSSKERSKFMKDSVAMRQEIGSTPIPKTGTSETKKYSYYELSTLYKVITPIVEEHHFMMNIFSFTKQGEVYVALVLEHVTGAIKMSTLKIAETTTKSTNSDSQEMKARLSHAYRSLIEGMFMLTLTEDTDAMTEDQKAEEIKFLQRQNKELHGTVNILLSKVEDLQTKKQRIKGTICEINPYLPDGQKIDADKTIDHVRDLETLSVVHSLLFGKNKNHNDVRIIKKTVEVPKQEVVSPASSSKETSNDSLIKAICTNNVEVLSQALENNPNLNVLNNEGQTPMYIAMKLGNFEVIKRLIDAGCDLRQKCDVKNEEGLVIKQSPYEVMMQKLLDDPSNEKYGRIDNYIQSLKN